MHMPWKCAHGVAVGVSLSAYLNLLVAQSTCTLVGTARGEKSAERDLSCFPMCNTGVFAMCLPYFSMKKRMSTKHEQPPKPSWKWEFAYHPSLGDVRTVAMREGVGGSAPRPVPLLPKATVVPEPV